MTLDAPIIGTATTAACNGDWQAASDGGTFAFGRLASEGGRLIETYDDGTAFIEEEATLVPRQATLALFSNAVRSRPFWGTPLPSSTIQVV